jgi:DNA polymerase III alpha subunit (gram-positive type)
MNLVVFDLETTGVNVERDEIIQLAALAVDLKTGKDLESFEVKIKPSVQGKQALERMKIEGFKNSYDADVWEESAVSTALALNRFAGWCGRYADLKKTAKSGRSYKVVQGCGYNAARFDHPFILRVCREFGVFLPMNMLVWDTLQLALFVDHLQNLNLADHKLSTVVAALGLDLENAHDALADVVATADVTWALLKMLEK